MLSLAIRPGFPSHKTDRGSITAPGKRLRSVGHGPLRPGASAEPRTAAQIRYPFRSFAADGGPEGSACDHLAQARALVEAGRTSLRSRMAQGAAAAEVASAYARLADDALVGLIRLTHASRPGTTDPVRLTALAVGRYGACEAMPGERLDLMFLVPDEAEPKALGEERAAQLASCLGELGFSVLHRTSAVADHIAAAMAEPRLLTSMASGRFIAGAYGPWAVLRARLDDALEARSQPRLMARIATRQLQH